MTSYREILRLAASGYSKSSIAKSVSCSRNTVTTVLDRAKELKLEWPLAPDLSDPELGKLLYPSKIPGGSDRKMPDAEYVRKELLKNGVSKKLLWTEYLEECRLTGEKPLMYSQYCWYLQEAEMKRRASMHIPRKPGEQVEVDWAGDSAQIIDPDTGEITNAYVFVGVLSFSQYTYAEAFLNEKQNAWITAHVHMLQFFGGVPRILVPDNCKTAVIHNRDWFTPEVNRTYHEMAEHYNTAIIPARVRKPDDKPNAEGGVRNISTWIIAALRHEQFFSLAELNTAIQNRLNEFNQRKFQKKDTSRYLLYQEELPLLSALPPTPYELAEWKQATVLFNYHVSHESMLYSVPYEYIGKKVDIRVTEKMIEIFFNHSRIASHPRLYGRKGQYSTQQEHMPENHQKYLSWDGDRFRRWAKQMGESTLRVVESMLTSRQVEQQAYRSCMGLLKLAEKYSSAELEAACGKAISLTGSPSYKSIRNILAAGVHKPVLQESESTENPYAITRGAEYYGR